MVLGIAGCTARREKGRAYTLGFLNIARFDDNIIFATFDTFSYKALVEFHIKLSLIRGLEKSTKSSKTMAYYPITQRVFAIIRCKRQAPLHYIRRDPTGIPQHSLNP